MRGHVPWWLVAGLAVIAGLGGWSVGDRTIEGLRTTNLTNAVAWGLWVALYIFFVGMSAGAYLLSTVLFVARIPVLERVGRIALYTSLVTLFTGLFFILLDLGHMERFPTVYTHFQYNSVLSWEIMAYALYIGLILVQLWVLLRADLARLRARSTGARRWLYALLALGTTDFSPRSRQRDHRVVQVLALVGTPVWLVIATGSGAIFAVAKARPYWFSPMIPIVFVVSGLASGSGLVGALHWATGDRRDPTWAKAVRALGLVAVGMVVFDAILLMSDLLVGLYSGIREHAEFYATLLHGPFAGVFWVWQIGLGVVVPAAIVALGGWRRPGWAALAGVCVTVGVIAVRLDIVIPSLTVPVLPGLDTALADLRTSHYYFPSLIEWTSSIGVAAGSALGWLAGYVLLPLRPYAEEHDLDRGTPDVNDRRDD